MTNFKRARNVKAKEARRNSILEAAATLYQADRTALPTTSQISRHCQISKGALYLYFKSKEEIFLAIIETYLLDWLSLFCTDNLAHPAQGFDNEGLVSILECACEFAETNPVFLQLVSMNNCVIEHNVDHKILLHHKNLIAARLNKAAYSITKDNGVLSQQQAAGLIMRSYSVLLGLWQVAHPRDSIAKVLRTSSTQVLMPDFAQSSRQILEQMWLVETEIKKPEKNGLFDKFFSR